MELILTRIAKKKEYTIGKLYEAYPSQQASPSPSQGGDVEIHDSASSSNQASLPLGGPGWAICDTLEPTWRDYAHGGRKIKGRSAIPEGRYAVVISYSPKFQQWLPILLGVPNFSGIRIHAGNTAKDTEGCILVGENREVGKVLDSRKWLNGIKHKIVAAKERGEPVWITIE